MEGTGFLFDSYEASAMLEAVRKAVQVYPDRKSVDRLRKNCMDQSFSWDRSAESYVHLYEKLCRPAPRPIRAPGGQ